MQLHTVSPSISWPKNKVPGPSALESMKTSGVTEPDLILKT
jgi:hypothetical protein